MGFQFLHTALLWGLGLVSLPVLIHFLRRRRLKVFRLPTYEFLLRTQRRIARRSQLKNWLLLALRISAVALVVFLASRPLFLFADGPSGGSWAPLHLVIVIDNSASMAYRTDGGTRFEVAKRAAGRLLEGLSSSDRASVVPTVPPPGEGAPPALEIAAARSRLAAVSQTDAAGTPARSLGAALRALAAPADRREIVVLSDFARSDWERLRLGSLHRLAPHSRLQFVRVAPEAGTEDLAIQAVRLRPWPPRAGSPFAAVVRVKNNGVERREAVPVSLFIGEEQTGSAQLDLSPGAEGTVSFRAKAPPGGVLRGRVEIGEDNFMATNRHYFAASLGRRVRTLVIDGNPRTNLVDSDSYYIAHALRAAPPGGDSPILAQVIAGYEMGKVNWGEFDLAVVCNIGSWPAEVAASLRQFVERGGGLFFAVGNLAGRSVPGEGWLPALLGEARTFKPALRVEVPVLEWSHPAFSFLGTNPGRLFAQVRIRRAYPLEAVRGGRTLLALPGGEPLFVIGSVGAGRVAVWGSTCDRDWTDLPVRPVFVPFFRGLVDELAGGSKGGGSAIAAGAPIEVRSHPDRAGEAVQVRLPSGEELAFRLEVPSRAEEASPSSRPGGRAGGDPRGAAKADAAVARITETYRAGVYEVRGPEGIEVVAANVSAAEAELDPLGEETLRERLPGLDFTIRELPAVAANAAATFEARFDLGMFLLFGLAAILVMEGFVADRS